TSTRAPARSCTPATAACSSQTPRVNSPVGRGTFVPGAVPHRMRHLPHVRIAALRHYSLRPCRHPSSREVFLAMNAAVDLVVSPAAERLFQENSDRARYARCIKASKRVRWDIDADVFRGRSFDFRRKFLPDGLTKVNDLPFLTAEEKRTMSHVQGRSYASIFGVLERFISTKTLEIAIRYGLGDQIALEGLVRFSDEEIKHQELFRRIETALGAKMPGGYVLVADANEVA